MTKFVRDVLVMVVALLVVGAFVSVPSLLRQHRAQQRAEDPATGHQAVWDALDCDHNKTDSNCKAEVEWRESHKR